MIRLRVITRQRPRKKVEKMPYKKALTSSASRLAPRTPITSSKNSSRRTWRGLKPKSRVAKQRSCRAHKWPVYLANSGSLKVSFDCFKEKSCQLSWRSIDIAAANSCAK